MRKILIAIGGLGILLWIPACMDANVSPVSGTASTHAGKAVNHGDSGVLNGVVSMSPSGPVQRPGGHVSSRPAANVSIQIENMDKQIITTVTTDHSGRFSKRISEGEYRLVFPSSGAGKNFPVPVLVEAGKETRIQIQYDSGIR
ncbi:MAG: carboxypeptidase-like regulatory domain-containing protein [Mariprofundus sp.]|nr:carboxypeptidase-like regulatory domain-containing protein [Mariprofundus sp.]